MKKIVSILLLSQLLLTDLAFVYAQESTSENQTVQEETQAQTTTIEAVQVSPAQDVNYDFKTPIELIDKLKQGATNISSGMNLLFTEDDITYQSTSRAYIQDGDRYYFITSSPDTMTTSALIETKEGQIQRSFLLAEDIAEYSAQALNENPDLYAGTPVESVYIYAQEHYDELVGLYIENPNANADQETLLEDSKIIQAFILDLFGQYVSMEGVTPNIQETQEMGTLYAYIIGDQEAQTLAQLAEDLVGDHAILNDFLAMFQAGYVGTLSFSLKTGDMVLSIGMKDGSEVLEYVLGMEETKLRQPSEDQIIDGQAFNDLVGVEVFKKIEE